MEKRPLTIIRIACIARLARKSKNIPFGRNISPSPYTTGGFMYSKTRTVMLITCLLLLCKFGLDQVSATQQQRRTREEVVKEREQLPKKAFEKFFRPDAKGEVYVTKAAHVRPGKKDFGVSAGRVVE